MSLQVEKLEGNMAKLTVEVPASEFAAAVEKAYLKQRGNMAVPGFRKGKVPRQMIEKMYGPEVFFEEATNILIPDAYAKAYDECELEIVTQPMIDIVQIGKGENFIFTAEVALKPDVKLGEYKGLEIEKTSEEVEAKEIDDAIEKELAKNARVISVEDRAVEAKDDVLLDFDGSVDGVRFEGGKAENYPLTIGSGSFIPGFEDQLIGAELGKELEVKVTFPEEYHVTDLAGKEAVFTCTINEIKGKELPELDEEFVSEISEFETVEEYKADVKSKLEKAKKAEVKRNNENRVVEAAVANASMDIPEGMIIMQTKKMISDYAKRMEQQGLTLEQYMQFTGMTIEKFREEMRPEAVKSIETRLVLEEIVATDKIEVSEEKFDAELAKMAKVYQMEVEKLKGFMGEAEKKQMMQDMAIQEAVIMMAESAVLK